MMVKSLPRPPKQRLDVLLVERGLAESRQKAQAMIRHRLREQDPPIEYDPPLAVVKNEYLRKDSRVERPPTEEEAIANAKEALALWFEPADVPLPQGAKVLELALP